MKLRHEYKYIIPVEKLETLRKMISPFIVPDQYAALNAANQYTVKSIYFDSRSFNFYFEKINHEKHRKKVRLRGYNNQTTDSIVFMEIKRKYEVGIYKNRVPVSFNDALPLFNGGSIDNLIVNSIEFPNSMDDAKRFMFQIKRKMLHPVINVIYEREAYIAPYNNRIRITLDKNLRSSPFPSLDELYQENRIKHTLQGYFIMEVKFDDYFPSWLKPIIEILKLRKEPASKYTLCIDSHKMVRKPLNNSGYTFSRTFNINHLQHQIK